MFIYFNYSSSCFYLFIVSIFYLIIFFISLFSISLLLLLLLLSVVVEDETYIYIA